MKNASAAFMSAMASPSRMIRGKVVVVDGGLTSEYGYANKLQSIEQEVSAVKGKMFGAVVSYKSTIKLIDVKNVVQVNVGAKASPQIGISGELLPMTPVYISSNTFDEVKGIRTLIGEDAIGFTDKYIWDDIKGDLGATFTIQDVFAAIASKIGTEFMITGELPNINAVYTKATFNVNGDETLRQILTAAAEATGAMVFINGNGKMEIKMLSSTIALAIDKNTQFNLSTEPSSSLSGIISINELNDMISVGNNSSYVAVISVNPFIDPTDDSSQGKLQNLFVKCQGNTFYPYKLKWRGNPALEIGDKIRLTLRDGSVIDTWYLGEKIKYTGGMSAESSWEADESEKPEVGSQTISDTTRRTMAKVDKANQKITLLTEASDEQGQKISQLEVSLDGIKTEVSEVSNTANGAMTKATTVEQTVDGLKVQVTEANGKADKADKNASAAVTKANELEITVNGYDARITAAENEASTAVTKTTELSATVDGISSEVTEVSNTADAAMNKATIVQQTVTGLSSIVTQVQSDLSAAEGKIDTNTSSITQLSNEIDLKVSKTDYTGEEIVSKINLAPDNIVISSPHIDLSGTVTVSSLADGTTTIDGACIKTGSVSANRISGGELSGVSLNIADKFLVSNSGVMTCTDANLGGTLNAVSGTFTNLVTTGSIKSSDSGGFGIEFSSSGDGFVGNRKSGSTFAGMQYISSADQLILTNSGNTVSFVGSGVSFIQMSGNRDYISVPRYITTNYGSTLPSSGTNGEIFFLIE